MSDVYNLDRIDYPDAPSEFTDDTDDRHYVPAPCQAACPVGTDAPSYIAYIWEGKFEQAFEAITATNPFSSICGRVCDAPCEPACRRTSSDGPIMIRNLKRFVMDKLGATYEPVAVEVSRKETVAIVGAGPAGLTAAHDLAVAGFEVHVYEMSDRLGGMMIWGIPAFRMPERIVQEDIDRLMIKCPGIKVHLNMALGNDITLDELKGKHDAVLLTIGSWWGKKMSIPNEEDERVVDGVGFLRRVNGGERPELPETVVVVGGGDVAMDASRVALRLPGCKHVKVVYRRGPDEIPARKIELEGAIEEGIEFIYFTQQVRIVDNNGEFALRCIKTELGEPDDDGRRRPVEVSGSEHDIECGMVIAAVGQQTESDELTQHGLMGKDRVNTDFESMRTQDPQVFAAGDGAFGGSTIVMAMHHGQKAAYYIKAYLNGVEDPLAYRTPYRTRRVEVAQDIMWEKFPPQEPEFFGVGKNPVEFPEIESTYDLETARNEAARCYRCDAETGSADYSVLHREDLFSMARTNPLDHAKHKAMLSKRIHTRSNPYPEGRDASLDDIVFLPANLSRLVIDPYREACNISTQINKQLELRQPFLATGFDTAPDEIKQQLAKGLAEIQSLYIGAQAPAGDVRWLQLVTDGEAQSRANGLIYKYSVGLTADQFKCLKDGQVLGLFISPTDDLATAVPFALEQGADILLLDGTGALDKQNWAELAQPPDFSIIRDTVQTLRSLKQEGNIDLIYFGGVRSGTDAAKLIGMGCTAVVYGVSLALAIGGNITEQGIEFNSDYTEEDRIMSVQNILKANASEASMMARCTGKTNLHNLEPEDLRSVTLATAEATGIMLA
jgi:NADPH-dependent glutamate synthase beta subunit-like oxidoreductase